MRKLYYVWGPLATLVQRETVERCRQAGTVVMSQGAAHDVAAGVVHVSGWFESDKAWLESADQKFVIYEHFSPDDFPLHLDDVYYVCDEKTCIEVKNAIKRI